MGERWSVVRFFVCIVAWHEALHAVSRYHGVCEWGFSGQGWRGAAAPGHTTSQAPPPPFRFAVHTEKILFYLCTQTEITFVRAGLPPPGKKPKYPCCNFAYTCASFSAISAAMSASSTSSKSPSINWFSLYNVSLIRWSLTRFSGKLYVRIRSARSPVPT